MSAETSIEIHPNEVAEIVQSVFATMLSLEAGPGATPWFPSGDRVTAAVQMAGEWNGAVVFECDRGQACRLAGRFLSMNPPETVDDMVRDVLGELANMIGGNLKCVLRPGITLSMPAVVDGSDYSIRLCGSQVRERLAFDGAEGPFWVTVMATTPPAT